MWSRCSTGCVCATCRTRTPSPSPVARSELTVAAALATRPKALVLDEPTFGQDARTWRELVAMLAALRDEGTALVLVTHDEPLVAALADDVLRLDPAGADHPDAVSAAGAGGAL